MLFRVYFTHGGQKRWLAAWSCTAGFPVLLFPIAISYYRSSSSSTRRRFIPMISRWLLGTSVLVGIILSFECYLAFFGISYLPVSVHSLVSSSQLVFTAVFAFFMVRQKFTPFSINAVVLMTLGSLVIGLHMNADIPEGESPRKYVIGFVMSIGAACAHGLFLTLTEYAQAKATTAMTFPIVMQVQFVISLVATLVSTVPMIINRDFQQTMGKEAAEFGLGEKKYYLVIIMGIVSLEASVIGAIGIAMSSSSLFAGIMCSLLVPVQQLFAVIFLKEGFNADRGMALALCLWGFTSHLYGGYKATLLVPKHKLITTVPLPLPLPLQVINDEELLPPPPSSSSLSPLPLPQYIHHDQV
ncbi:Purine permease 3 [Linum grandiflorum]